MNAGSWIALVLLTGALLVHDAAPGLPRIRALTQAATAGSAAEPKLAGPRPAWVLVATVAAGTFGWAVVGPAVAAVAAATAGAAGLFVAHRAGRRRSPDETVDLASCWDLLAVSLRAGLPVPAAVEAAALPLLSPAGASLRRVAGLLELGADPAQAWQGVGDVPALSTFARAACRSAGTGAALADIARSESQRIRTTITDAAQERAQRAAVLITGPLGLCFLPAFLVLGIGPVVIGLAEPVLTRW